MKATSTKMTDRTKRRAAMKKRRRRAPAADVAKPLLEADYAELELRALAAIAMEEPSK